MTSFAHKTSVQKYWEDNKNTIESSVTILGGLFGIYQGMDLKNSDSLTTQFFIFFLPAFLIMCFNLNKFNEVGSKDSSFGLILVWGFMTIAAPLLPAYFLSPMWSLYTQSTNFTQFLTLFAGLISIFLGVAPIMLVRYLHKKSNDLLTF
jgi:hypothetical protein